jgi:hypothetical protein
MSVVSWIDIDCVNGSNIIVVREVMPGHFTISLLCETVLREINNNAVHSAEVNTKKCLS